MSFSRMIEYLQVKNKGKIVFVNAGNFYIAMGKEQRLILIPKAEKYIEYMLNIIYKLPRTEKFSIGTEYEASMYKMLEDILIISKINKNDVLYYLNKIDAGLNVQRIYLRIMKKERWIDIKKFNVAMEQIYEIFKNKQGVNFCGYKINEYRLKIRDKGKRKLKKKIKSLKEKNKKWRAF